MAPIKNGRVLFNEVPEGLPVAGKTTIYDESHTIDIDIIPLNGGFVAKLLSISVDPYLRGRMRKPEKKSYSNPFTLGEPISNYAVSVVLRSEDDSVKPGDHVYGLFPYQEYSVLTKAQIMRTLDNKENLPWSLFVGILGMTGQTAYYAWKEYAQAKAGETAFISAAAGAVGATVVQFAKADGMKVIASSGSEEKVELAKSMGADVSFNYKTSETAEVLQKEGPISVYWDNVGGPTLEAAIENASTGARFIECGMISGYNGESYFVKNLMQIVGKQLHIHGFIVGYLGPKYDEEFYSTVPARVASGEIKYKEHVYKGLEGASQAIVDVQSGANFGKAVIVVAEQ
ncbi:NAD(P)-binding protein [Epithele typhae]|uniref:NAD(P)-binding protein n=1 Tax=Epithele typhae TaxID=378194 RepID=UPI0020074909|nr:NAD(P)-binding protein [Epithele typhae]KAH9935958.1 NAD(P)-binding protein [Epithele typhae]